MEEKTSYKIINPITDVILRMTKIFTELGFSIVEGPELELEKYNFDMLNVPKDHPARDMQDTFWLKPFSFKEKGSPEQDALGLKGASKEGSPLLMRTQTSAIQARFMEKNKPPFKIVCPGKTYRKEATDAGHELMFQQIEGLYVDKEVSLATLKTVLNKFFDKFFEKNVDVRFRSSYFPFVEPGAEIDISCFKCDGGKNLPKEGNCPVCKGSGWVEVMGAGVVHPKVLDDAGIDSKEWKGFAFGGGIERMAMLKYGIDDIRLFYSGDLRLINQFRTKNNEL